MGGPWFTVQTSGEWDTVATITLSNGTHETTARVEARMTLEEHHDD